MTNLLKIQFLKEFWQMKNNKLKLITSITFNILVFFILIKNFKTSDDSYIFLLASLSIFIMIMSSFMTVGEIVIEESKNGNWDNYIGSPYNSISIIFSQLIVRNISTIFKLMLIIYFSLIFTNTFYEFKYVDFIVVAIIGNLGLYGISFILASISFISNEIKLISNIFKILFMYVLLKCSPNIFIPFSYAKKILLDILFSGNIFSFSIYSFSFKLFFVLNSVIYIIIGLFIFNHLENKLYSK